MTSRAKFALGAALVLTLGFAAVSSISPLLLLTMLDGAMGGGAGTEKAGSGIAFGTQGQKLDVWRPQSSSRRPAPVLIFWYGGGWVHGSRGAYAFAARAFAKHGFIVVVPDYRKVQRFIFPRSFKTERRR